MSFKPSFRGARERLQSRKMNSMDRLNLPTGKDDGKLDTWTSVQGCLATLEEIVWGQVAIKRQDPTLFLFLKPG